MQTLDAPITQSKYPIRVSYIPKQKAIQTKQSQTEKASPKHNKQRMNQSINPSDYRRRRRWRRIVLDARNRPGMVSRLV